MEKLAAKSGEQHSEEEWEAIRPTFGLLYKAQGRPLSEVRRLLAEWFGFHATLRQYKTRIHKWEETKKVGKQHQDRRSTAANQAVGERSRLSHHAVHQAIVTTFRLPRIPPTHRLGPPGHLGAIHMASNGISRFYAGVLRGGEVDRSLVRSQRIEWNISQFYMTAIYISTMASASQWTLVQDLYPRLLDHVEPLLQERNPIVAVCLLQICARFYQAGQSPVLNRFLAFVKAITSARGSETHPLRLLASAWLQGGEKDSALDLIARGSQQAYDIVSKQLGPEHPQTLSVSRALHSVYSAQRNWTAALSVIESTVNTEAKLNLDDLMTVDARLRMVRSMIALDNLQGAADILDAQESSVRRMTESGQINSIQAKRLLNPLQSNRAEMLRRQLDPRAEAVAEELMSEQTISSDTHELSVTIQLHRHLQLIRATLKTGVIEPYDSPC